MTSSVVQWWESEVKKLEKKICRNLWNILPLLLLPFQHCSKSYVAVLTSFGRRQRAHKGWRFPVLLLHQIWFHLSAPWWKVIRGGSDLEQREISTSLRRWGFVESVRLYPANWSLGTTPWMADLKVSLVDLCRAWTPPPEILRNRISPPSVFTRGARSPCLLTFNLSLFCLD